MWSGSKCRPVRNQLGADRRSVGNCFLSVRLLSLKGMWLFGDQSATDRRLIGDQPATKNYAEIVCNHRNWSKTSRQTVPVLLATTKNLSTIDLVTERFPLLQAKPPCDQIGRETFLRHLQPVGDQTASALQSPASSLRPLKIMVAGKSPTGCKLCVTGALES